MYNTGEVNRYLSNEYKCDQIQIRAEAASSASKLKK